ncbi:MAG TPA: AAA family ATPase [Gaiellaceae bacterium]|nr:AAA family ATPase [Gaiellaceae bacterium]
MAYPEARKVVTVLFTDVAGSTALGERLDPELLRNVMGRYFEAVQAVVERHGGTVEKFIGDAVMAVFGVPAVREDDPLRAVRAAAEIGAALSELNDDLAEHGVEILTRTGLNTGEVVVGGAQSLATGDAVNVAARLEQAASPGEVLLGATTYAAVADLVHAEPVAPIDAKGKSAPLVAYRLVGLRPDVPAFTRPIATPFVGRREELGRLRAAFDETVATGTAQLATIVGTPGIGKSRLARELLGSLADEARVLIGRCTAYGEGVPYLPLADVVRDAGDIAALLAPVGHGNVAARLIEGGGSPEETAWAFRLLFETLAHQRPVVLVVDDIHWADPALLDLLEYVAASGSGAPIFVLCTARPDLFDTRPTWATPRPNATLVVLEPLGHDDSDELVDALAHELAPELRERVVATAEGNPLFVEQLLAHFADDPETDTVPPSIQALLAARIDRLEPDERAVVQRGSVEGRLFHRGAVADLLDDQPGVGGTLLALARKEFVRPDRSLFPGDDGFRFNHVLIRDVAYASMPKELRSRLHARLADWLDARNGHLAARDETIGYHLEQAYLLGAELGRRDRDLALRGGALLAHASLAALGRGEPVPAAALARRASALLAAEPAERVRVYPLLGHALRETGALAEADAVLAGGIELARELGDEPNELRAAVERGHLAHMLGTASADEMRAIAERALAVFDDAGDLSDAWQLMATSLLRDRNRTDQLQALLRAREYAIASGDTLRQISAWNEVGGCMLFGPTPLAEVRQLFEDELAWGRDRGIPSVEADGLLGTAYVAPRVGDFVLGRQNLERSRVICREFGIVYGLAEAAMAGGELEVLAGDLPAAERELREAINVAANMEAAHYVAVYQVRLARVLHEQGRHDEAATALEQAKPLQTAMPWWKSGRARVLAARGELDAAVALAREAAAQESGEQDPTSVALTLVDLSEVLLAAGDGAGAMEALSEAIDLNERKGNLVAAEQCRERMRR